MTVIRYAGVLIGFAWGLARLPAATPSSEDAAPSATASPALVPVPFQTVKVDDPFWSPRVEEIQTVTVPDLLELAESQGKIDNFRIVAGKKDGSYRTYNAADSDVYKLIEAAAYTLAWRRAPELEKRLDALIDDIVAAQQPDGYLDTQFTLPAGSPHMPAADDKFVRTFGFGPEGRWNSHADNWPKNYSQLYCAGHLFEAAVAYRAATGKMVLFNAAQRLADHLVKRFPIDRPLNYADHPEVEIGLMRLYEATGRSGYLKLADYFARNITFARPVDLGEGANRAPLAEQRFAWGHAVRTAYLFTGATDVVRATGATDLRTALFALWHSIFDSRIYVHGGVGGPAPAEQLQPAWLLDSAQTYSESCAAIAQGQWNHSLNLLTGDARYADVVEHEMYNGALSGLGQNGTTYLYSNPLAAGTEGRRNEHSGVRRRYLFCCPSKLPGFVAGVGRWAFAVAPSRLVVNQFLGAAATATLPDGGNVEFHVRSGLPWNGDVTVELKDIPARELTLSFRIPEWARGGFLPTELYHTVDADVPAVPHLSVNGSPQTLQIDADGYVSLRRTWSKGDVITLNLPMSIRRVYADPRAEQLHGRVAVARGPVLYCLEGVDQPKLPLQNVQLRRTEPLVTAMRPHLLNGVVELLGVGVLPEGGMTPLTFVPYYAWDNRGICSLAVWLVEDPHSAAPVRLPTAPKKINTNG